MIYNDVLLTRQTPSGNANRHIFCAAGNNKKVSKRRNRATGRRATLPPGGSAGFGYVSRVWVTVWVRRLPHPLTHESNPPKSKGKVLFSLENRTFWSCWADSNRRPHPYQKAVNAFVLCPFMPIKALQSLVLQGVGGLFAVEKFYWIPIWIMWI